MSLLKMFALVFMMMCTVEMGRIFFLIALVNGYPVPQPVDAQYSCPDNCVCGYGVNKCWVNGCEDGIATVYAPELYIYGPLCYLQRQFIREFVSPQTYIILADEYCEDLENCV